MAAAQMDPKFDTRDAEEHAAVAAALAALPASHPACIAYFLDHECTIGLTHLVDDQELARNLTNVYLDGYNRMLRRTSHFRP